MPDVRQLVAAAAEPGVAVAAHGLDDVEEGLPLLGEGVLDSRWHLSIGLAVQNALTLKRAEALRERLGADTDQRALKLTEALGPGREVADDQKRPLSADDLSRARDGTDDALLHDGCDGCWLAGQGGSMGHAPAPLATR